MLTLDVGCGQTPKGQVNCDLFVKDRNNHRGLGNDNILKSRYIPNLICCEANKLPFKNDIFSRVYCRQLIEHMQDPYTLLKELYRVSNDEIIIETTHRLGQQTVFSRKTRKWFKQHHISYFNFKWFHRAFSKLNCRIVKTYVISWTELPSKYFCLFKFPYEIGLEISKRR